MTQAILAPATPGRLLSFLPHWRSCALFAAIAAVLLWAAWGWIQVANTEIGDFAANSLLVLEAKSGILLKGNYSRVGFNHPGPALLYVLVLGEVLLFDTLHLVPSPFSGQLAAAQLYHAVWLVLAWGLLRRFATSFSGAVLASAVFIAALVALKFDILTGIWFPDLYCMPFLVMLLAAARLTQGRTDSVAVLAVSSGFLVNGHASFAVLLVVIMLAALLGNWQLARRDTQVARVTSLAFCRSEARALWLFGAIVLLFMLPLLARTLMEFPGPVYQYLKFGSGKRSTTLLQAVQYVAVYWTGLGPMLAGLAASVALWSGVGHRPSPLATAVQALLVVLWGATVALLMYARVGIDMLDQVYIGQFYYVVPPLALAVGTLVLYQALAWRRKAWLALPLALLALVWGAGRLTERAEASWSYHRADVAQTYQVLAAVPRKGRLVLDLTDGADWGDIWARVLALQVYAKRQGDDLLCVNRHWHISFTEQGACTDAELATGVRYLVRKTGSLRATDPSPVAQGMELAFVRQPQPQAVGTGWLRPDAQPALFADSLLAQGWSAPEGAFVWGERKKGAVLMLPVEPGFVGTATLDVSAFLPRTDALQSATVLLDGVPISSVSFSHASNRKQILVPVKALPDRVPFLTLRVTHHYSPAQFGSADRRVLGVALYGLKLDRTP